MIRPILVLLCVLLALPVSARAEETTSPDSVAAGEIGRGLLSPKVEVREKAQARLLERLKQGGDPAAFVKAMSDALAHWANRSERLMEVWLQQAVHGNEEEREQAVKLLTALGEPAIRRLSLELRHRLQHGGTFTTPPTPPVREAPQHAEAGPATPTEPSKPVVPVIPQIYKLGDLLQRGMNPLELRGLLQKAADAVEVKKLGVSYIVMATQEGHDALLSRLDDLRKGAAQIDRLRDQAPAKPKSKPKPQQGAYEEPQKAPAPPKAAPVAPGADDADVLSSTWRVEPVLVHLPVTESTQGYGQKSKVRSVPIGLPVIVSRSDGGIAVHVGTAKQSLSWARAVRRIPDARSEDLTPLDGLPLNAAADFFAGKRIRYTGDVQRTKGGAWSLVTKTIRHGTDLKVDVRQVDHKLRIHLTATRTDVGLPIPVVRVKPSKNAAPVEIERPEWSSTRGRATFDLAPEGGGAFIALNGLAPENERLVLVLTVVPARAR